MTAPIDVNFDLQDNGAFIFAEDDGKADDMNAKLNSETTESSFQTSERNKKTMAINTSTQDELKTIITICVFFGVSVTIALILTIYLGPPQVIPHGVVSSRYASCSEIGGKVLKSGGSAIDSSVSVVLCESVYDTSIIFGCGVLTFHDQRKNSSSSLDFSCSDAHKKMTKGEAAIYPTLLSGLAVIQEHFGLLKWKDVLYPVINFFKTGNIMKGSERNGSWLNMIELLEDVSQKGVNYFYNDYLPKINWTGMNSIQLDELRSYRPNAVPPQKIIFNNYFLESVQGSTSSSLLMLISVLQNLTLSNKVHWNSTNFYHYFVEAVKLVEANGENITMLKTSDDDWKSLAKSMASQIIDDKVLSVDVPWRYESLDVLTVSVIGPNDDLMSLAVWHDNSSNVDETSSVKMETTVTLIIHDIFKPCALRLAIASKNYITLAQVLINHFGNSMNLSDAISAPKLNVVGNTIFHENFPDVVIEMLREKGHSDFIQSNTEDGITIICKDKEDIDSCIKDTSTNVYKF